MNVGRSHWVCLTTIDCSESVVRVMDSLGSSLPQSAVAQVASFLIHRQPSFDLLFEDVDMQPNGTDCGLYSLAFATTLCSGGDPVKLHYKGAQMRNHLMGCLEKGVAQPFPATRRGARRPRNITTVEIYCHCRMPEGKVKMVQCIACREWFHEHCEKIPDNVWRRRVPKWKCCSCNA